MKTFDAMGKAELRAACKEAGIKNYGKMNNDGMRTELREIETACIAKVSENNSLKIEKNREERNGIKRPSLGGKCRAVWNALDAYYAEMNEIPTVAIARLIAQDEGWNQNNTLIEFYQWRKFNGIGR